MACVQAAPAILVPPPPLPPPLPPPPPPSAFCGSSSCVGFIGTVQERLHDFVKYALLQQLVPPGATVCDLHCGHGLDTEKWARAQIGRYVGVEFAASALEVARERWNGHNRPYPAEFCEVDPCMSDLQFELRHTGLPADFVCCMEHLQDCFFEEDVVRRFLLNVASILKPGGYFFGTTPDSSTIWSKYQKAVEGAHRSGMRALPRVNSEHYVISFEDDGFTPFGTKYTLQFTDGVMSRCQTLIHFPSLIRLAEEVGLEYIEIQNLQEFYEDYRLQFSDILRATCGNFLDPKGRLMLFAYDVLSLYTTFIFKKTDHIEPGFVLSPLLPVDDDQMEPFPGESMDVSEQAQQDDYMLDEENIQPRRLFQSPDSNESNILRLEDDQRGRMDFNGTHLPHMTNEIGESTKKTPGVGEVFTEKTRPFIQDNDRVGTQGNSAVLRNDSHRSRPLDDSDKDEVDHCKSTAMEVLGEERVLTGFDGGATQVSVCDRKPQPEVKRLKELTESCQQLYNSCSDQSGTFSHHVASTSVDGKNSSECKERDDKGVVHSMGNGEVCPVSDLAMEAEGLQLSSREGENLPCSVEPLLEGRCSMSMDSRHLAEASNLKMLPLDEEPNEKTCTEEQASRDALEPQNSVRDTSLFVESATISKEPCEPQIEAQQKSGEAADATDGNKDYHLEDGEHPSGKVSIEPSENGREGDWHTPDNSTVSKHMRDEEEERHTNGNKRFSQSGLTAGQQRQRSSIKPHHHTYGEEKQERSQASRYSSETYSSRVSRERGVEEHKGRHHVSSASPRVDDYRHHSRSMYQLPGYATPMVPQRQAPPPVFKSPNTPGILGPGPPGLRIKDPTREMLSWPSMSNSPTERKGPPPKGRLSRNPLGDREVAGSRGHKEIPKRSWKDSPPPGTNR